MSEEERAALAKRVGVLDTWTPEDSQVPEPNVLTSIPRNLSPKPLFDGGSSKLAFWSCDLAWTVALLSPL